MSTRPLTAASSPDAWGAFGWGAVCPGTVVSARLDTSSLDVVLTRIGEALRGVDEHSGGLEARVSTQDGGLTALRGGVEGLLAFRDELTRRETRLQQHSTTSAVAAAAAATPIEGCAGTVTGAQELVVQLRTRFAAMSERLSQLEGGDNGGPSARAWDARAAAAAARLRALGVAQDAAHARLQSWLERTAARGSSDGSGEGESDAIEGVLGEYARMDADVMPLPRGLSIALALARSEIGALAADAASLDDGSRGGDAGAQRRRRRAELLAELDSRLGAVAAGVGAAAEIADEGRRTLLRRAAAAASAHRVSFTDLALKAAMADVDVRAGGFETRVMHLRGRLAELSQQQQRQQQLLHQVQLTGRSDGTEPELDDLSTRNDVERNGGGGRGDSDDDVGRAQRWRPASGDAMTGPCLSGGRLRPSSAAAESPGADAAGVRRGGGGAAAVTPGSATASSATPGPCAGSPAGPALDAVQSRLRRSERTAGALSQSAAAVRAEVDTISGVLTRLDDEVRDLRASATHAQQSRFAEPSGAAGAMEGVSDRQVRYCNTAHTRTHTPRTVTFTPTVRLCLGCLQDLYTVDVS